MNITLIIGIVLLVFVVMAIIKVIHLKHKIYAVLILLLIVFLFVTGSTVIGREDIDITTGEGILRAGKLYLGWMGHFLSNAKTITGNAIKMDWEGDLNISESSE